MAKILDVVRRQRGHPEGTNFDHKLLRVRAAEIGPKRPLRLAPWRQLTGQDRSRQPVGGAAEDDPSRHFALNICCGAQLSDSYSLLSGGNN